MKRLPLFICALFALILAGAAPPLMARAEEGSSAAAPESASIPFSLLIVGTRHYADADVMSKNIRRIQKVQRLVQTVSSQNHVQFAGVYGGAPESLLADIQGLAQDRFEVQSRDDQARGLVITLRKIQADESSPP